MTAITPLFIALTALLSVANALDLIVDQNRIGDNGGKSFYNILKILFYQYFIKTCTRHNYMYLYLAEFQSQNPFRLNCQSVKVITFYF